MKKTITTLLILIFSLVSHSQNKTFSYTTNGLQPNFIVEKTDSLKQKELFEKSINWIKETYKNPDKVIKTTIGQEKIRFEGIKTDAISQKVLFSLFKYDATYTIEIMFKDGKYRFQPISLTYFMPGDKNYSSQTITVPLSNINTRIFKKNGKIRSEFKNTPLEISNIFNELNISLKSHLLNNNKNDTW